MMNTKPKIINPKLNLQIAIKSLPIPTRYYFRHWFKTVLAELAISKAEVTIRIVGCEESAKLNKTYRKKTGATNVLSFPFEAPSGVNSALLGDIVICAPVIEREAAEQDKPLLAHWAHITIHGILHLLGYDHIKLKDAFVMEALEIKLLKNLGFSNPYKD